MHFSNLNIEGTLIHRVTVLRISLMKMHMINDNVAKNCIICGFCRSGIWSTILCWNYLWRIIFFLPNIAMKWQRDKKILCFTHNTMNIKERQFHLTLLSILKSLKIANVYANWQTPYNNSSQKLSKLKDNLTNTWGTTDYGQPERVFFSKIRNF